jgi:hypothetical protein
MLKAIEAHHAPVVRGNPVRIKYVTQLPTVVPSFAFFAIIPTISKHLTAITWRTSCASILSLPACRCASFSGRNKLLIYGVRVFGNGLQHSGFASVASHSCTATTAWAFEKV